MIYLLGITHTIQTEWDNPGPHLSARFGRFKTFLSIAVHSTMVAAIAEETSHEIENRTNKKSIARLIAEGMHPPLFYVPCEANSEERKALGIPTAEEILDRCRCEGIGDTLEQCRDSELLKYFPLREKFWIERLRQVAVSPILFLCGPAHIRTFFCRLTENGIPCKIISFDWEASDETDFGVLPLEEMPI
ncbi:MAG: hypothetical protein ACYDC8_05190 [Gammaproteobacteria bacterium]